MVKKKLKSKTKKVGKKKTQAVKTTKGTKRGVFEVSKEEATKLVKTKKQKNAQPASHKANPAWSAMPKGVSSLFTKPITRRGFLKEAGAGFLIGAATLSGLGKTANAQAAPTPPTQYATDYIFKTLAAVVDTNMPGVQGESVDIVIFNETGEMIPLGTMNNLGSDKTDTPGAAFLPQHDGRTLMPCYQYLYLILPQLAHEPTVINQLIAGLDDFAKQVPQNPYANFMDLPYDLRYYIFYIMNKEDIFASLLIQQGVPQNVAITQALQVKRLIVATIFLTNFIYYSELCNLAPDPTTGIYTRDKKNSWESSIIAGGAWEQMGYAGPSYKEANFASVYEGLRVTIADGKVKFQS